MHAVKLRVPSRKPRQPRALLRHVSSVEVHSLLGHGRSCNCGSPPYCYPAAYAYASAASAPASAIAAHARACGRGTQDSIARQHDCASRARLPSRLTPAGPASADTEVSCPCDERVLCDDDVNMAPAVVVMIMPTQAPVWSGTPRAAVQHGATQCNMVQHGKAPQSQHQTRSRTCSKRVCCQ